MRWITEPADLADADLIVLPGSKATVADLSWLRERGLARGIVDHARAGRPVLGICGGFQMLCRSIEDTIESGPGRWPGWGCWTPTSCSPRTRGCGAGSRR
ncbi:glutamine amidotransferase class-I family protein [Mycobacterium kansasii 824]|nr:glutamine amidotransferase class-I family protein [Mycobacterium kansasii 824]